MEFVIRAGQGPGGRAKGRAGGAEGWAGGVEGQESGDIRTHYFHDISQVVAQIYRRNSTFYVTIGL